MSQEYSLLYNYEYQLLCLCLDDSSAMSILSPFFFNPKIKYTELEERDFIVDFVYINLISGLIEVDKNSRNNDVDTDALRSLLLKTYVQHKAPKPQQPGLEGINELSLEDFQKLIATLPPAEDNDPTILWCATFFIATQKTHQLAEKYGLNSWRMIGKPIHEKFMNEVIQIYSDFDTLTKGCSPAIAEQRITVAKRVLAQLTDS